MKQIFILASIILMLGITVTDVSATWDHDSDEYFDCCINENHHIVTKIHAMNEIPPLSHAGYFFNVHVDGYVSAIVIGRELDDFVNEGWVIAERMGNNRHLLNLIDCDKFEEKHKDRFAWLFVGGNQPFNPNYAAGVIHIPNCNEMIRR